MSLKLHHVNVCGPDVQALHEFYRNVLGLATETPERSPKLAAGHYAGPVAFVTDGTMQLHLGKQDHTLADRAGQAINPVAKGHIAFRTDDIDDIKRRLKTAGIAYSDYGDWAVDGWHQIFFIDPAGTVVEVHQVPTGEAV